MLITRSDGFTHIPVMYWVFFTALVVATPAMIWQTGWKAAPGGIVFCVVAAYAAINSTFRVRRVASALNVHRGWKLVTVQAGNLSVGVEHDHRYYYRVTLSDGTAISGSMLVGACVQLAGRMAAALDIPAQIRPELRQAGDRKDVYFRVVLLLLGLAVAAGLISFALLGP